jgi:hypothetical protein
MSGAEYQLLAAKMSGGGNPNLDNLELVLRRRADALFVLDRIGRRIAVLKDRPTVSLLQLE